MLLRVLLGMLLALGTALAGRAQTVDYRPYYTADSARHLALAKAQRDALQAQLAVPREGNAEFRSHYRRVVQEAADDVYNVIRYSALLDPLVEPYVQGVFGRLLRANPHLPADTRLVLSRNPEANAYATGTHLVVLNLGLLPRLENDSQLAFVLGHELGHLASHHFETHLRERLLALHSRDLHRQYRRIINSEYNISSQLKTLALGFKLEGSYHQRRFERQADSLGYVLLARAGFEAPQAYRALQLLDQVDRPEHLEPLALGRHFACPDAPRAWATPPPKPASIFTVAAAQATVFETSDTLKSHPDCAKRMRYVQALAQGQVADAPGPPVAAFEQLRAVCRLELVQSWFDYDCYDHALFEALQLLRQQPHQAYLRAVVQLSLFGLRQRLQQHRYNEVVSNVSARQAPNFNELLHTLHELELNDFRGLSTCFAQVSEAGTPPPADEFGWAAGYAAAALAATPEAPAAQAQRAEYERRYPAGRFARLLFPPVRAKARR